MNSPVERRSLAVRGSKRRSDLSRVAKRGAPQGRSHSLGLQGWGGGDFNPQMGRAVVRRRPQRGSGPSQCSFPSRWVDHRSDRHRQLAGDIWVAGPRGGVGQRGTRGDLPETGSCSAPSWPNTPGGVPAARLVPRVACDKW